MTSWPVSRRLADVGVRLLYLVAAIALLWVAKERLEAVSMELRQRGQFSELQWLSFVGAGILAGVMAGLAIRPTGMRAHGYRWEVALLLGIPPALLVFSSYAYFTQIWLPPTWLLEVAFAADPGAALLIGLAIVAGLTARGTDLSADQAGRRPAPGG